MQASTSQGICSLLAGLERRRAARAIAGQSIVEHTVAALDSGKAKGPARSCMSPAHQVIPVSFCTWEEHGGDVAFVFPPIAAPEPLSFAQAGDRPRNAQTCLLGNRLQCRVMRHLHELNRILCGHVHHTPAGMQKYITR